MISQCYNVVTLLLVHVQMTVNSLFDAVSVYPHLTKFSVFKDDLSQ